MIKIGYHILGVDVESHVKVNTSKPPVKKTIVTHIHDNNSSDEFESFVTGSVVEKMKITQLNQYSERSRKDSTKLQRKLFSKFSMFHLPLILKVNRRSICLMESIGLICLLIRYWNHSFQSIIMIYLIFIPFWCIKLH